MTRRLCYIALFTALALTLHYLESLLPPLLAFAPGAKMGLSNVVSLVALFLLGVPEAYAILLIRCLLASVIGGNPWSLAYALPAGVASLTVMTALVRTAFPRVTLTTVSFAGALAHNAVQLTVASLTVGESLLSMLPLFLLASLAAGLFVGRTAYLAIKYMPRGAYLTYDKKSTKRSLQ